MSTPLLIRCSIRFRRCGRGAAKELLPNQVTVTPFQPDQVVPRLAQLMALAIRFDGLLRAGVIKDYATLARLGHVSRARITQIMNLLKLAPDIQEEILFLEKGHAESSLHLRQVQPLAALLNWRQQRRRWRQLRT